jgi:nucleoside-diphosphate-sugar epimerase
MLPPMRVLVTGATGFLGGVVARRLTQDGYTVTGTGRDPAAGERLRASGVNFVSAELRRPEQWESLLDGADAVIHSAARSTLWGRWEDFVADNVTVSARLAQACARRGLILVHVSTPSVYNATGHHVQVPESLPVGPRFDSLYARSKFMAEEAVRLAHPAAVVLRPRGLYGPGDTALVPRLARALRTGRLPRLTRGEVWTELTHVDNAAHAAALALAHPVPGLFNVTDGEAVPLWATLDRLADRLGVPRPRRYVPPALLEGAATVLETLARLHPQRPEPPLTASGVRLLTRPMSLDLTRARTRLGYVPPVQPGAGLDDVLRRLP